MNPAAAMLAQCSRICGRIARAYARAMPGVMLAQCKLELELATRWLTKLFLLKKERALWTFGLAVNGAGAAGRDKQAVDG